jgi:putative salt-induced outer membrane protein YdiY/small nuclear ribonucleoprotein (snRNP)-like protein
MIQRIAKFCSKPFSNQLRRTLLILSALLFSLLGTAAADQVTLKNGDRISGDVVSFTNNELVLNSPILGNLKIPWAQITGWEGTQPAQITLQNGQELTGTLERFDEDGWVVRPPDAEEPVRLSGSEVRAMGTPKSERDLWSGKVSAGMTLQTGNTDSFGFNFRGRLSRRTEYNRLTFEGAYERTNEQGVLTTDKGHLSGRYDHNLTDRLFLFGLVTLQTDQLQQLDFRHTETVGPGYFFIKNERTELSGEAGLSHVQEFFSDGSSDTAVAGRLAAALDQKIWNSTLSFRAAYLPKLRDPSNDFLANGELVFSIPLTDSLSFEFIVTDEYDNDPEPGVENNDVSVKTNLGYSF